MPREIEVVDTARRAAQSALNALLSAQDEDSLWRDFMLPVGMSDQWVPAVVAIALARAGAALDDKRAIDAAAATHDALLSNRKHSAGFGFNGIVDADADSTAAVIMLGHALFRQAVPEDLAFLLSHEQPDGGFATFICESQWGVSHACVTAAVATSLPDRDLCERRCRLLSYLRQCRNSDGTWNSYWWSSSAYASRAALKLLRRLRPAQGELKPVTRRARLPMNTPFDRILALDIAVLLGESSRSLSDRLNAVLVDERSGRWAPSKSLRLTEPDSQVNATNPKGRIFPDTNGIFSTALALDTLIDLIEAHGSEVMDLKQSDRSNAVVSQTRLLCT